MFGSMTMSAPSMLIVEPHPMMREALYTAVMERAEWGKVTLMERASEALQIAPVLHPTIIVISLGNPGDEDLEAIQALRAVVPSTAILALTSAEVDGQERAALQFGADAAVAKSAPRMELLTSLRMLQQNRLKGKLHLRKGANGKK